MKFILLSIAAMFIKLTVKHFLTLKPYCFWTFRSRDWIWPKQKGCQILCFFCFDLAGPSLEEKPRNKIYVPNLDRWTPLQNRHQPKGAHFISWTCLSAFVPQKRKPCQYYLLLKSIFCWAFKSRTNIAFYSKKHATKSWIPTSHPVHL